LAEESRWKIPLTRTTLDEAEEGAALRVLRRKWLSMGEEVAEFEREFAAALGSKHAVALSNGTAALRVAYEACGLREGDAIAMPALTFVAAMNTALRLGLKPLLADVRGELDLTSGVVEFEAVRAREPKLKAIVTMPYGGWAPPMTELRAWCTRYGIVMVEDACHGLLGTHAGRALGTFGRVGTFSFFPNKNMTTGEGGMAVTDDEGAATTMRRLRSHGMTTMTWDRERGHAAGYDVELAGDNLRMDEIRAAIGREQLRKVPLSNERRRRIAREIVLGVRELGGHDMRFPFHDGQARPTEGTPAAHLLVGLLPEYTPRETFRASLAGRGVQTSVHYPALDSFSHVRERFAASRALLPRLRAIESRIVTLPLAPNFTDAEIDYLCGAIVAALSESTR